MERRSPSLDIAFKKMQQGTGLTSQEAQEVISYYQEQDSLANNSDSFTIYRPDKGGNIHIHLAITNTNSPNFRISTQANPVFNNTNNNRAEGGNATATASAKAIAKHGPVQPQGSGCSQWLHSKPPVQKPEQPEGRKLVGGKEPYEPHAQNAWYRDQNNQ